MSQSRNPQAGTPPRKFDNPVYNYVHDLFSRNDLARTTGQFATTLPIVVSSLYTLDVAYALKSVGTKQAYHPSYLWQYFLANRGSLMRGYFATYLQAGSKNLVLANSGHVHGHVKKGVMGEEHPGVHNDAELPLAYRLGITGITTGLISGVDLLSTNVFANVRFLSQIGKMPPIPSYYEWLRFAFLGSPARYASLYISAGGYIAGGTLVKGPMDKIFPGFYSTAATTILTGWIAGILGNGFNIIRNNQLKQVTTNKGKLTVPSALTVAKQLMVENGPKAFFRGGVISAVYGIVAYSALGVGEYLFTEVLFPGVSKKPCSRPRIEEVVEETTEVKAIEHTDTPVVYSTKNKSVMFQQPQTEDKGSQSLVEEAKKSSTPSPHQNRD